MGTVVLLFFKHPSEMNIEIPGKGTDRFFLFSNPFIQTIFINKSFKII
jgi:hypothetical protein